MATTTTLQCPLCSQPNFVSIDSLRSSLIDVTNRPLICPICNEIQMGLDKLTIHLLSHSKESSAFVDTIGPPIHTNIATVSPSAVSDSCQILIDRTETVPKSPRCVTSNSFAGEVPDCQFCGSTFRTTELRRMHMQLVHELFVDKPATGNNSVHFQCNQCPKRFKMEGSLHLHCRMVHGKLSAGVRRMEKRLPNAHKPAKLNVINNVRSSDELSSIKLDADDSSGSSRECITSGTNTNTNNGDDKTFDCTTCGKSFTTKYFLKKHKRLHTGVTWPALQHLSCRIVNRSHFISLNR